MMQNVIQLQNRLHEALDAFLFGSILKPSRRIPGTRLNELHPYWAQRLDEIAVMISGSALKETVRPQRGAYYGAACILSEGYRVLNQRISGLSVERVVETITPGKTLGVHNQDVQKRDLFDELRRYWTSNCGALIQSLFVHGSYSTQDNNAYSDLDALVIIKKHAVEDTDELYGLGLVAISSYRYLLAADLLQHHGHFVLTEIDLEYYCDAYFPRILFDYATELYSAGPLNVRYVRSCHAEAFAHLKKMCLRFTQSWDRRALSLAYYLKLQLSCFMIIPALLMQALGRPCYKRESFMLAKPLFTPAVWRVMDEVSDLRRTWRQTDALIWKRVACARPFLWNQLVSRFGRWGVPDAIWEKVSQPDFQESMRVFSQQSLDIAAETLRSRGVARLD